MTSIGASARAGAPAGHARWLLLSIIGEVTALGGLYGDDALHTDVGRDSFWTPAHLVLYAGVAVTVAGIVLWGFPTVRRDGLRAVWREPVLRDAAVAAGAVAVSAPTDAAWHTLFGRDAVLWSPPHLLGVIGTFALAVAVLRAATRGRSAVAVTVSAGAVLSAGLVPVMEYESDVPQYPLRWFLPVVAAGLVLACRLIYRFDPAPWAATRAAVVVTGLRLAIVAVLWALGHSTPLVPPVLIAAVVLDLTRRWLPLWWTAVLAPVGIHVGYLPWLHLVAAASAPPSSQLLASFLISVAAAATVLLLCDGQRLRRPPPRPAAPVLFLATLLLVVLAVPGVAAAHDPGQGAPAGTAEWQVDRTDRTARITVVPTSADLTVVRLLARRAGAVISAPFTSDGRGGFRGSLTVPDSGRWFLYATFLDGAHRNVETWIPVRGDHITHLTARRSMYRPQPRPAGSGKTVATVVLDVAAGLILAMTARGGRRWSSR